MMTHTSELIIAQARNTINRGTMLKLLASSACSSIRSYEDICRILPHQWVPKNVNHITLLFVPVVGSIEGNELVNFIVLYCIGFKPVGFDRVCYQG